MKETFDWTKVAFATYKPAGIEGYEMPTLFLTRDGGGIVVRIHNGKQVHVSIGSVGSLYDIEGNKLTGWETNWRGV